MSSSISAGLMAISTITTVIYGGLHLLLHLTQDAREPPPVPASVPFVGPMIDLSRKKSRYYAALWGRYKLPACTIRLPGARLYVINATSLIPAVQRQYKTLAFPPLQAKLAMNVCGSSQTANDILNTNATGDEGAYNRRRSSELFDFVKREVTLATTDSVYGDQNPFRDPAIFEAFWSAQICGYFKEGGHEGGSALIKARYAHSMSHKISVEDIARFEIAGAIAILINTSPTYFWQVYHLYSSPSALEDCRRELGTILSETASKTQGGRSGRTVTLDLTQAKTSCPTLLSSLQEVLRLHSVGISTRQVIEDHDAVTWGKDIHSFDHRRFLPNEKRPNSVPRGFGGGTTLCPGRHFASTETFAFTALIILRFDMHSVGDIWK
ncbi:cytochrome P450 [Karstenula rhodostoma CBS 690.94]|uniref:Cytochrome P450 n=1 Tax=Karstenula rhodostoma CBS 690.94 TaxID=1392251 RepID=A0A9P4PPS6_9PLEO|nr:cytochrome P450 [Karstenula rhodostoma CBS 690.94]